MLHLRVLGLSQYLTTTGLGDAAMERYIVDVEGERYEVTIRETKPGHFEMLAWIAPAGAEGDSAPTPAQREAFGKVIKLLRDHPPTP